MYYPNAEFFYEALVYQTTTNVCESKRHFILQHVYIYYMKDYHDIHK